jgi:hypothetical protein
VDKKTQRSRAFSPMRCHGAARIFLTAPRSYDAVALHRGACEKLLRDRKLATSSERKKGVLHARLIVLEGPGGEISDEEIKVGMALFLEHGPSCGLTRISDALDSYIRDSFGCNSLQHRASPTRNRRFRNQDRNMGVDSYIRGSLRSKDSYIRGT